MPPTNALIPTWNSESDSSDQLDVSVAGSLEESAVPCGAASVAFSKVLGRKLAGSPSAWGLPGCRVWPILWYGRIRSSNGFVVALLRVLR